MPNPNEAVTEPESAPVQTEPVPQEPAEDTADQPQAVEETTQTTPTPTDDVDERGVPWKNVAMEAQRKLQEMPTVIEQTVQQVLQNQKPVESKPKYTIEQLEAYAIENPQHRPWVESQKAQLLKDDLMSTFDEKLQATKREGQEQVIRQQSEQWVTAHPKFKDCFVTDAAGRRVWNMANPLTQIIGGYLNQADPVTGKLVRDRADGLVVAAKLAWADYSLSNEPKSNTQVSQLKKDLRKAQKATVVPGGGTPQATPSKSGVRKSVENYNKTYNKNDIQAATKQHLLDIGLIKEE